MKLNLGFLRNTKTDMYFYFFYSKLKLKIVLIQTTKNYVKLSSKNPIHIINHLKKKTN